MQTRTVPPTRNKWLLGLAAMAVGLLLLAVMVGAGLWVLARRPAPAVPVEPRYGLVCLLVNRNSNRCLTVANGALNPGAKVVQGPRPDAAGPGDRWVLVQADEGAFRLRHVKSGHVLEVGGAHLNPGALTIVWPAGDRAPHQQWTFEPVGDDTYLLRVGHSNLVLAVGESALEEGASALQWDHLPDVPDQLWKLQPTGP